MRIHQPFHKELYWYKDRLHIKVTPDTGYDVCALRIRPNCIIIKLRDLEGTKSDFFSSIPLPVAVNHRKASLSRKVLDDRTVQTVELIPQRTTMPGFTFWNPASKSTVSSDVSLAG